MRKFCHKISHISKELCVGLRMKNKLKGKKKNEKKKKLFRRILIVCTKTNSGPMFDGYIGQLHILYLSDLNLVCNSKNFFLLFDFFFHLGYDVLVVLGSQPTTPTPTYGFRSMSVTFCRCIWNKKR